VQAGNMAHLLNHSCEPNCYSRLTDVYDEGICGRVEHVILYAKRDIAAFEELTYDYR
jgi:SET domain-containing protein